MVRVPPPANIQRDNLRPAAESIAPESASPIIVKTDKACLDQQYKNYSHSNVGPQSQIAGGTGLNTSNPQMLSRVRLFTEIEPGTTVNVGTIRLLKVTPTELGWERFYYKLGLTACQRTFELCGVSSDM